MIGKLVASHLAGAKVGQAIGPIAKLSGHIQGALGAGQGAIKGTLQSVVDLLGAGAPAGSGAGLAIAGAGGGVWPLPGIPFIPVAPMGGAGVGGVLFDKAAEILTDLEEITGAYWDEGLGQLVLMGKKNGRTQARYLPKMDKDHLAVAMRAAFSNDNIGVSIDQPPGYEKDGSFPPEGAKMPVRYLGNTQDTLFGAIMFEADKLLKNLSMGEDNETGKKVSSNVSGFRDELDLSARNKTAGENTWTRMWFVIEDMKLSLEVKESSDRNSLVFGKSTLKVKAEYLNKQQNPGVNPAAEEFAKHFTLHFDEFAREYPILERLRELAKIAAIAKYLKDSGKPVDLSFLADYEFIKVKTPKETPGISVSKSWQEMNTIHTYRLYGGVDFDFEYQSAKNNKEAEALKKAAQDSKPCPAASAWEYKFNGAAQKAIAVSTNKKDGNYSAVCSDLSFSSNDGLKLELGRFYNSFNARATVFGHGWDLIPYKFLIMDGVKAIFIIDKRSGKTCKYTFVKDKGAYFLVEKEKAEGGRAISFSYDANNFIKLASEGEYAWESGAGPVYNFDREGKLISAASRNNSKISYIYQNGCLAAIADDSGRKIELIYDRQNRIKQAVAASEQRTIDYLYDVAGDLIKVSDGNREIADYAYDADHRLISIKDGQGKTLMRKNYDAMGRIVSGDKDIVIKDDSVITRTYDNNRRLAKEEDTEGNRITYEYDKDNNLSRSVASDKSGKAAVFEYDAQERIKKIADPSGVTANVNYDAAGRIISIIDANGGANNFKYDNDGNIILFHDAAGSEWKQEFDESSNLLRVSDPLGRSVSFAYKAGRLTSIKTPAGVIKYSYDIKNSAIKITDTNGNSTKYFYDTAGSLTQVKDALGKVTKYAYDPTGNLISVAGPK